MATAEIHVFAMVVQRPHRRQRELRTRSRTRKLPAVVLVFCKKTSQAIRVRDEQC